MEPITDIVASTLCSHFVELTKSSIYIFILLKNMAETYLLLKLS